MTEDAVKSILSGNIRHLRLMKDFFESQKETLTRLCEKL